MCSEESFNLMSQSDVLKEFCLNEELYTSIKLIELGFGELQNLNTTNDFYFLPFQLISSGLERLMKCHICVGYFEENGHYPDKKFLKKCGGREGHDLLDLKNKILESYFNVFTIPALKSDHEYLLNEPGLEQLIFLLSEFGKFARYYNLDVITAATKPSVDVQSLWSSYEMDLIKTDPVWSKKLGDVNATQDLINFVNREIIFKLECFVRAICRQFTIGKLGEKALQHSIHLTKFICIRDSELGNTDYRINTNKYNQKSLNVSSRTKKDEKERKNNPNYRHEIVRREDFKGDWPFYHDEVIIECRYKYWCVVTIDNIDYALNGSAKGRYKLEFPFEAGMAILGKNIHPFIEMALDLGKEN